MATHPLPPYIQGESIYSFVAQIHHYSVDTSGQHTNLRLFNTQHVRLHPILPAHVNDIATKASLNPFKLLLSGTAYSLYAFALTEPVDRFRLMNNMLGYEGGCVIRTSLQAASKLAFGVNLKLCPSCLSENEEHYGNSFWHTVHQLYGVNVCPTHGKSLSAIIAGEGEAGRKYLLPNSSMLQAPSVPNVCEIRLSKFITQLHHYLNQQSPLYSIRSYYQQALRARGLMTKKGNLRLKALRHDLTLFWEELFQSPNCPLPPQLSSFQFVSKLVHTNTNMHYVKHVLLMAYLADTPEEFFNLKHSEKSFSEPAANIDRRSEKTEILSLLTNGLSMRKVSVLFGRSVGFIKQLAKRHGASIGRRTKIISETIERSVWRKAFIGQHREDIAEQDGISVSSVEQIIQSHKGLSGWRKHLRFVKKLKIRRTALSDFLKNHPDHARNQIITECPAYLWLFKHDKAWLYEQLPPAEKLVHHPSMDWDKLDNELSNRIMTEFDSAKSLSEIDRHFGGHGWLPRKKEKLPKAYQAASTKIVSNQRVNRKHQ